MFPEQGRGTSGDPSARRRASLQGRRGASWGIIKGIVTPYVCVPDRLCPMGLSAMMAQSAEPTPGGMSAWLYPV